MQRLLFLALLAAAVLPAQLPEGVESELDVAYDTRSPKQKLDLFYRAASGGPLRPGMVIVHGGGWRSGDKGGGPWRLLPIAFAGRGYVAISVNYRLTGEAPEGRRLSGRAAEGTRPRRPQPRRRPPDRRTLRDQQRRSARKILRA